MDTSPPDTGSLDASVGNADVAAVACNPQVLGTSPPTLLSQTGCFEPGKPGRPIAAFFPYEVNSPLWEQPSWTNGSAKSRVARSIRPRTGTT